MVNASLPDHQFVGTAGWSIASDYADLFPAGGSHLERYASRLDAVEINSSFYRPHRVTSVKVVEFSRVFTGAS